MGMKHNSLKHLNSVYLTPNTPVSFVTPIFFYLTHFFLILDYAYLMVYLIDVLFFN